MEPLQRISSIEQIKSLADIKRLEILRILMKKPATLSQLGKELGQSAAHVRHHLLKLEQAGLISLVETRVVRGFIEKYYQATGGVYLVQDIVLPASNKPNMMVISGSHDLALEMLVDRTTELDIICLPVGSLDGLVALRQGSTQVAGCHLLDTTSGEYNIPYLRHFFPDRDIRVVTLAQREQGLIVADGNPLGIRRIDDLVRTDIRFANRNPGSGTRLWLDWQIHKAGIGRDLIRGYETQYNTHTLVAKHIAASKADAGLGQKAAALQYGLDFIPLFRERYDLVIPVQHYDNPKFAPFFEELQSKSFRKAVNDLGGYETTLCGNTITT